MSSDHLVEPLGLITCEGEVPGQVAKLVLTLVGVRGTSDFKVRVSPRRCRRLQTSQVDREETVETEWAEQAKTGETSERKGEGEM